MALRFNRKALKEARRTAGLSLTALGTELDCSRQQVFKWENGPGLPTIKTLERIWIVLDVTEPGPFFINETTCMQAE